MASKNLLAYVKLMKGSKRYNVDTDTGKVYALAADGVPSEVPAYIREAYAGPILCVDIRLDRKYRMEVEQLVWFWAHGMTSPLRLFHKDGNPSNCALGNLGQPKPSKPYWDPQGHPSATRPGHQSAKLTEGDVAEIYAIRDSYYPGKVPMTEWKKFPVTYQHIHKLLKRVPPCPVDELYRKINKIKPGPKPRLKPLG